jgi:endonuclease/exonuclease/phosphatase (EEP) superfamily protein YafD
MPCAGTFQRDLLYCDILSELQSIINSHTECNYLIGGDFNVDLNSRNEVSLKVNEFINLNNVHRCNLLFPLSIRDTFINNTTNAHSAIDYMLTSNSENIVAFNVLDLDINLSDHLPIMSICACTPSPAPNICLNPLTATVAKTQHQLWSRFALESIVTK